MYSGASDTQEEEEGRLRAGPAGGTCCHTQGDHPGGRQNLGSALRSLGRVRTLVAHP